LIDKRFRVARILRRVAWGQHRSTYYKPKNQQTYFLEQMCQWNPPNGASPRAESIFGIASSVRYGFGFFFGFAFLFRRNLIEYVLLQQGTI
jgi:hypothetical protein